MVPDRKLLQQIRRTESSSGGGSSGKTDPYLDFFLALAICNTVVVSTATVQRQRVSAPFTVTLDGKERWRTQRGRMSGWMENLSS